MTLHEVRVGTPTPLQKIALWAEISGHLTEMKKHISSTDCLSLALGASIITLINPYKKDSDFGDKAQSNENQKTILFDCFLSLIADHLFYNFNQNIVLLFVLLGR